MRLSRVRIENFRGIRRAALADIGDQPLITMSGRNGVGKSLGLFAILLAWRGTLGATSASQLVGPWGSSGLVELTLSFAEEEWTQIRTFAEKIDGVTVPDSREIALTMEFDDLGRLTLDGLARNAEDIRTVIRHPQFRAAHSFAQIDLIPAERQMSRYENATPDAAALSTRESDSWRQNFIDSLMGGYGPVSLFGVMPYLSALDYAGFLESRRGGRTALASDYTDLVGGFARATGKRIGLPELAKDGQIAIFVDAGAGNRHSLSLLSSGEQEALGLMYLVRRLSARGGILLIDEPEQHLHPSLQRTIVAVLEGASGRSQLWLSTHSPALISGSSLDSVVAVHSPALRPENQFERVSFQSDRLALLTELGMPPSAWQQGDVLLVVEGRSDERYLTRLLPMELSRALILVAGNAAAVERVSASLKGKEAILPWVAVRDRDLADNDEVHSWEERDPRLFVWSVRSIENLFLESNWVSATLSRVGVTMSPDEVRQRFAALALDQQEEIVFLLTERRLDREFPAQSKARRDLKGWYEAQAEAALSKRDAVETTLAEVRALLDDEWEPRWREWVQAKRLLAQFVPCTPFRSLEHLLDAMVALASEDHHYLPKEVITLRARLLRQ